MQIQTVLCKTVCHICYLKLECDGWNFDIWTMEKRYMTEPIHLLVRDGKREFLTESSDAIIDLAERHKL